MASPKSTYVLEHFALTVTPGSVDREKGLIGDVRIVGPRSKSGRKYPAAVSARRASLYGAVVNIGHHFDPETMQPVEVPVAARFGRILDPKPHDSGLNGKLKFNPEHPFARPFLWAIENDPGQYSFSPFHRIQWQRDPRTNRPLRDADGDLVAEDVLEVVSVDVVSDGGVNSTIFESAYGVSAMTADPVAVAAELTTGDALKTFLTDLFSNLPAGVDATARQAALEAVLSALGGEPVPADGAAAAMESLRRMGRFGQWAAAQLDGFFVAESAAKRRKWAADLCKAEGLRDDQISGPFIETVMESRDDATAKARIADRRSLLAGTKPPVKEPITSPPGTSPKSVKDIVATMDLA